MIIDCFLPLVETLHTTMMERFSASANLIGFLQSSQCPAALKRLAPLMAKHNKLDYQADGSLTVDDNYVPVLKKPKEVNWKDAEGLDNNMKIAFISSLIPADMKNLHPPLSGPSLEQSSHKLTVIKTSSVAIGGYRFACFHSSPNNSLVCVPSPDQASIFYLGEIQEIFFAYFLAGGGALKERLFFAVNKYLPVSSDESSNDPFHDFEEFGAFLCSRTRDRNPIIIEAGTAPIVPAMRRPWDDKSFVVKPTRKVSAEFEIQSSRNMCAEFPSSIVNNCW